MKRQLTLFAFLLFAIIVNAISPAEAQNTVLSKSINTVIDNYLSLKDALTNADGNTAETAAKALLASLNTVPQSGLTKDQAALFGKLEYDSRHISEVNLVPHQREHFASLSKNLFALVKGLKLNKKDLYWEYCSMRSTYYISESPKGKDPYMGMSSCSKVKETLPGVK